MNNRPQYQNLNNIPVGCTFCGATVHGKVLEKKDPKTQQVVKECRWVCSRCANLVKVGNLT